MEPSPDQREVVECRVYTHGRRHPIVIGNIQGLRIPPVTPAQLGLAVSSAVVEVLSALSTWTVLIDAEPPERVPGEFAQARADVIARGLAERAIAVLPRVEADGGGR